MKELELPGSTNIPTPDTALPPGSKENKTEVFHPRPDQACFAAGGSLVGGSGSEPERGNLSLVAYTDSEAGSDEHPDNEHTELVAYTDSEASGELPGLLGETDPEGPVNTEQGESRKRSRFTDTDSAAPAAGKRISRWDTPAPALKPAGRISRWDQQLARQTEPHSHIPEGVTGTTAAELGKISQQKIEPEPQPNLKPEAAAEYAKLSAFRNNLKVLATQLITANSNSTLKSGKIVAQAAIPSVGIQGKHFINLVSAGTKVDGTSRAGLTQKLTKDNIDVYLCGVKKAWEKAGNPMTASMERLLNHYLSNIKQNELTFFRHEVPLGYGAYLQALNDVYRQAEEKGLEVGKLAEYDVIAAAYQISPQTENLIIDQPLRQQDAYPVKDHEAELLCKSNLGYFASGVRSRIMDQNSGPSMQRDATWAAKHSDVGRRLVAQLQAEASESMSHMRKSDLSENRVYARAYATDNGTIIFRASPAHSVGALSSLSRNSLTVDYRAAKAEKFCIHNADAYMNEIEELWHQAGKEMHPKMKALIDQYVKSIEGNKLSVKHGAPGLHGDLVTLNDALHQGKEWKDLWMGAIRLKEADSATASNRGEKIGDPIAACLSCTRILGPAVAEGLTLLTGSTSHS